MLGLCLLPLIWAGHDENPLHISPDRQRSGGCGIPAARCARTKLCRWTGAGRAGRAPARQLGVRFAGRCRNDSICRFAGRKLSHRHRVKLFQRGGVRDLPDARQRSGFHPWPQERSALSAAWGQHLAKAQSRWLAQQDHLHPAGRIRLTSHSNQAWMVAGTPCPLRSLAEQKLLFKFRPFADVERRTFVSGSEPPIAEICLAGQLPI